MNDINPPVPSLKSLIIASIFATLLASLILISAVLPAEYGIDPTGLGKMMGLTALSAQTKATSQPLAITCPVLPPQAAEVSSQDQKQAANQAIRLDWDHSKTTTAPVARFGQNKGACRQGP